MADLSRNEKLARINAGLAAIAALDAADDFSKHADILQERVSPLPRVETPTTEDVDGASSVAPLTPKEEQ